ncbi:MAG: BASS family bile acid:Na+ symporter [Salibacteraceae bacterium]|jgi:BASS family bile acid:Na+ symporter
MSSEFSDLHIAFSQDSLMVLNLAIAFIMFGVALGINKKEFFEIKKNPKSIITGVISQFFLLPLFTFLLILILNPLPELALGMLLVASSPGGNVSNFYSQQSNGNVALSVSLTAIATISAVFMTPLNFEFYGRLYMDKKEVQQITIEFIPMFKTVFTILIVPLFTGLFVVTKFPHFTKKIVKPIRLTSFAILMIFMGVAFSKNLDVFTAYYKYILVLVLLHNGLSFLIGYYSGKLAKLPAKDIRTITIETGIQNSGLSLVLIFTLFNGNGGMALLAAWWGIWHIISGGAISYFFQWSNRKTI